MPYKIVTVVARGTIKLLFPSYPFNNCILVDKWVRGMRGADDTCSMLIRSSTTLKIDWVTRKIERSNVGMVRHNVDNITCGVW